MEYAALKPLIEKDPRRALKVFSDQKYTKSQGVWSLIFTVGGLLLLLLSLVVPQMLIPSVVVILFVAVIDFFAVRLVLARRSMRRSLLWRRISKDMSEDGKGLPFTSPDIDRLIRAVLDVERKQRIERQRYK